jgi:hypothetical protein
VEDTILEDAMKTLVKNSGLENSVAILESYMLRWAARKVDPNQKEENVLCRY